MHFQPLYSSSSISTCPLPLRRVLSPSYFSSHTPTEPVFKLLLALFHSDVCSLTLLPHYPSTPTEPILLDGLLQAVTLKTGDVVAVRTNAHPIPTYFGCYEHQMQLNPKSIHRPVLSAVMQADLPS